MLKPILPKVSLWLLLAMIYMVSSLVAEPVPTPSPTTSFKVELETTEGCECVAPCPCYSLEPASFSRCRALKFYQVTSGMVDGLDLTGRVFVAAIADSPQEMYKLRDWHGAIYFPESASEIERKALRRVANHIWGGVYRRFETRVAPITYVRRGETCEATIGDVGHLVTAPLFGPDGAVKRFPKDPNSKSGIATRNHFDDGHVKWDLAGRSVRIGPMTVLISKPNT